MVVEVFVFDGDGSLFDVVGNLVERNRGTVAVGVDFKEGLAVAIRDNGGDGVGCAGEFGGGRELVADKENQTDEEGGKNEANSDDESGVADKGTDEGLEEGRSPGRFGDGCFGERCFFGFGGDWFGNLGRFG